MGFRFLRSKICSQKNLSDIFQGRFFFKILELKDVDFKISARSSVTVFLQECEGGKGTNVLPSELVRWGLFFKRIQIAV